MLDWNKVKQDKELIKRVETLVESVCDTFYDFPQDVCDELNNLTGNNWKGEEYINYCAEYWSSKTLEQTVWAIFHNLKNLLTIVKNFDIIPKINLNEWRY